MAAGGSFISHCVRALGAVLLCMAIGCERDSAPMTTVFDSAGVRITMTRDSQVTPAQMDGIPALSLGGPDAAGPTQFFRVQNVVFGRDGRLWIADGQSNEIQIFNGDGSHSKTIGGRGAGPGEFMRLRLLGAFAGDTVAAWDDSNGRVTLFDGEGDLVRTETFWRSDLSVPRAFDVYPDGTILAQQPRIVRADGTEPGRLIRDSTHLVRVDFERRSRTLEAAAPGQSWLWTGQNQVPVAFTSAPAFDVQGHNVHLAQGSAFQIKVFREGQVIEIYGIDRPERPVSSTDLDAYRAYVDAFIPESQQGAYLDVLDHPGRPATLPAYARLIIGPDGHTWAQLYAPASLLQRMTWDVFDQTRRWAGRIETPQGFWPISLSGETVAGVWFDDNGVEHVRVYRFQSPGTRERAAER